MINSGCVGSHVLREFCVTASDLTLSGFRVWAESLLLVGLVALEPRESVFWFGSRPLLQARSNVKGLGMSISVPLLPGVEVVRSCTSES